MHLLGVDFSIGIRVPVLRNLKMGDQPLDSMNGMVLILTEELSTLTLN